VIISVKIIKEFHFTDIWKEFFQNKYKRINIIMNKDVDWYQPDWTREQPRRFWDPGRKLLLSIRYYQKVKKSKNPVKIIKKKICVLRHMFWSIVSGAEIDLSCNIGGGLLIPHPNGIVIYPGSTIGVNCLIFQQVTLAGIIELGYHVDIGAGAKLIGPLKIGNNVRIGANAVVTKDVQDGITVAGVPAVEI
jgi:serine O-acetyltransferase